MNLNREQKEIINDKSNKICVCAAAGSGKALTNNTGVYTDAGIKGIGYLTTKDKVIGSDGKLHSIIGVYPQFLPQRIYEIEFEDGYVIQCSKDHLWTIWTDKEEITIDTTKLLQLKKEHKFIFVPTVNYKNFANTYNNKLQIDLEIAKFFGKFAAARIFHTSSLFEDDEKILHSLGVEYNYEIDADGEKVYTINNFKKKFNIYAEWTKSLHAPIPTIPIDILNANWSIKQSFLTGFLQGFSHFGEYYTAVSVNNFTLVLIEKLLSSCGFIACSKRKIGEGESSNGLPLTYYTVVFRKADTYDKKGKLIKKITKTNHFARMTCIKVDTLDSLFLIEGLILTHNTTVLTEKVRSIIDDGVNPKQVVAITFTNLAAEEMQSRLGEKYKDCFIGTMHSYANYLLKRHGHNTEEIIMNKEFENLLKWSISFLPAPQPSYLLVDEFQDISDDDYNFLSFLKAKNEFFVGDPRQCIYEFKGARPDIFEKLTASGEYSVHFMHDNYRSDQNILRYAENILYGDETTLDTYTINKTGQKGKVYEITTLDYVLPLEGEHNYNKWMYVARTNKQLLDISDQFAMLNIPHNVFRQGEVNREELRYLMNKNAVVLLTIHGSKGLERKNVVAVGCNKFNKEERRVHYVAATRAKNNLFILKPPKKKEKRVFKV